MSEDNQENDKLKTVEQDARYHNANVTNWCFETFVSYQKCTRLLGDGNACCGQFQKIFKTICPNEWIKKWEEQIEKGNFPVDLPPRDPNDCEVILQQNYDKKRNLGRYTSMF